MTAIEGIEEAKRCPFCGGNFDPISLGRLGLSAEELLVVAEHVKKGTLRDVLRVAEIALRRLDPETTNVDLQVDKTISKLREASHSMAESFKQEIRQFTKDVLASEGEQKNRLIEEYERKYATALNEIATQIRNVETLRSENSREHSNVTSGLNDLLQKIGGTGLGKVGETITIRDLKRVAPMDSFDEMRASKQGSDIIAKVIENEVTCGTVTVSVKYTQSWSNEYVEQISNNMQEDGSKFGVLVSRAFPKEALSDKAWVLKTRNGNLVILVKPEYASLAYFGLRQATMVWFQSRRLQVAKEQEVDEMENTFKALMYWINGEEFQEFMRYIDCAVNEANKTKELMNALKKHISNKITDMLESQDQITDKLTRATGLARKLRELLNGKSTS